MALRSMPSSKVCRALSWSVSTPTTKAGNDKLLRHYRSKIADLEARLSAASSQHHVAQPTSPSSPSSSHSRADERHREALRFSNALVANSVGQDRTQSSDQPQTTDVEQQAARQESRQGHDQASIHANIDAPLRSSYQPIDHLYWPDSTTPPGLITSAVPQREPSSATSAMSASLSAAQNASPLEDRDTTQTTQPSGPIYFGSSAGVLYRQPDSENVSSVSIRMPSRSATVR